MTTDEFVKVDATGRAAYPKIWLMPSPARRATEDMIVAVERKIGAALPVKYRWFLQHYGGGEFGLLEICSADEGDYLYMPTLRESTRGYCPDNILPVSPDGCGGYYGFNVVNSIVSDAVIYWYPNEPVIAKAGDILEFIADHAYSPNGRSR